MIDFKSVLMKSTLLLSKCASLIGSVQKENDYMLR